MSKRSKKHIIKIVSLCIVILLSAAFIICNYCKGTTIVAVGDIAKAGGKHAEVAKLISSLNPEKVLTLGDNAYVNGTLEEFNTLYEPTFGAFKSKTAPSPGNHEYNTPGAAGYYDYFGPLAGPDRRGYYSFDIGSWHIVSLNSEVVNDAQNSWLEDDLQKNTKPCILAYFHKPLFSSGSSHGGNVAVKPLWIVLYKYGADLVLSGHEHFYERHAKQNPEGVADPKGIRQFIVGTGGAPQYGFGNPNQTSEVRGTNAYGALKLTLKDDGYSAVFKAVKGSNFSDRVSGKCN